MIQRAVAQQAGDPYLPTPVVFSFGWVAYAFSALLASVGDGKLMPSQPDYRSVVIGVKNAPSKSTSKHNFSSVSRARSPPPHPRENTSWIIGRFLRDYERKWMPLAAKLKLQGMLRAAGRPKVGLCVSVFEAVDGKGGREAGVPLRDLYWWSGYVVAFLQLGVAAMAWGLLGDWVTFTVVAAGTMLAFTSGSLWQWRRERWSCRRKSDKTFVLTSGNGAQHAIVVLGCKKGLDMEDLAAWTGCNVASESTKFVNGGLLACWIVLLLTVSGMKNNTWVLLAIGGVGMLHTIVVAGAARRPEAFGIHLKCKDIFMEDKTMRALALTESKYPLVGQSMIPIFFPGGVLEGSADWVNKTENEAKTDSEMHIQSRLINAKDGEKQEEEHNGC